jgi:hypothetical protein
MILNSLKRLIFILQLLGGYKEEEKEIINH